MTHPHLKVWKGLDGLWHWHTTSINSNILSKSSEGYDTKAGAQQGFIDSTEAHLRACGMLEVLVELCISDLQAHLRQMKDDGPNAVAMILEKSDF